MRRPRDWGGRNGAALAAMAADVTRFSQASPRRGVSRGERGREREKVERAGEGGRERERVGENGRRCESAEGERESPSTVIHPPAALPRQPQPPTPPQIAVLQARLELLEPVREAEPGPGPPLGSFRLPPSPPP